MSADSLVDGLRLNIRAEMGRQRVSMAELSRRTKMPRTTLTHQIDTGTITVETLGLVAAALELDPAELLPTHLDGEAVS